MKPKKSKKETGKQTLPKVVKEMPLPRLAKSCRREEEDADRRVMRHGLFLNA
jgi:hypothetical protein